MSTSDIHLEHQMHMNHAQVIELTKEMVELCVSLCPGDVEFSAMDATRRDVDFLAQVLATAVAAGATTINVPDTVGYALPAEYAALFDQLYAKVPALEKVDHECPLPQRSGGGCGQHLGGSGAWSHAGGGGHERHRRAGGQRRA